MDLDEKNRMRIFLAVVAAATVLAAYYIWSTHRRYYIMVAAENIAYEVDRKTGETWLLHGTKKILQKMDGEIRREAEELPAGDEGMVTGNAGLRYGLFSGRLYNGSEWFLSRVIVNISAKEENGTIRWSRDFSEPISVPPLSTGAISITVANGNGIQDVSWSIKKVYGFRK